MQLGKSACMFRISHGNQCSIKNGLLIGQSANTHTVARTHKVFIKKNGNKTELGFIS